MKFDEERLVKSDEVLLALTHRAAYQTIKLVPFLGYIAGAAVLIFDRSHIGVAIGITAICFAFLASLVFELTLGYYGVSRGLEELKRNSVITRSAAIKRIAVSTLKFMYVWFSVSYFAMSNPLGTAILDTLGGAVILVFLMALRYRGRIGKIQYSRV